MARRRAGAASAALQALALLLAAAATAAASPLPPRPPWLPAAAAQPGWWRPTRWNADGTLRRFQYQLADSGAASVAFVPGVQVYGIDFDTAAEAIPRLKARDRSVKVVCYFSAGSWEEFRVDEDAARRGIQPADWPAAALGSYMAPPWTDERWVDVRRPEVRAIMARRLDYCRAIGCDGVDPDNVNGHENDTGFPLAQADLLVYLRFLAAAAHARGLAIGLKNGLDMVPQLHPQFDFAISESCAAFGEGPLGDCAAYAQPRFQGKPIWDIEYCDAGEVGARVMDAACFCPRARARGINAIIKRVDLGAAGISCAEFCKRHRCQPYWATGSCAARLPPGQADACAALPATPLL